MSISLGDFIETIKPSETILFFGSGSSIPSGAPSVSQLEAAYETRFNLLRGQYTLGELTDLAEGKSTRRETY